MPSTTLLDDIAQVVASATGMQGVRLKLSSLNQERINIIREIQRVEQENGVDDESVFYKLRRQDWWENLYAPPPSKVDHINKQIFRAIQGQCNRQEDQATLMKYFKRRKLA